jgi:hypothetical protein
MRVSAKQALGLLFLLGLNYIAYATTDRIETLNCISIADFTKGNSSRAANR